MSKTSNNKVELCIKLRNGNIVTGLSNILLIDFTTDYGVLNIPSKQISLIEFGLLASKETKQKVAAYVDLLQSGNEVECKQTFKSLTNIEVGAIPVLESYLSSDNCAYPEYNVEAALLNVKEKYQIDDYIAEDIVTLQGDYRFPGESKLSNIEIETEFGQLNIPREKIISVELIHKEEEGGGMRTFKVEAAQHISANTSNGWFKTNMRVNKGQKFSIKAKGEIVMASLANQIHKPSGEYMPVGGTWTVGNDSPTQAQQAIFGNLVFKIGENGAMQKGGTNYSGTAPAAGIIYLSIYETVFNPANTGSYTVSVKV